MRESSRKIARVCMLAVLATVVGLVPMRAVAEESETDLAKKTQNPVADLISVPFQNNFNFFHNTLGRGAGMRRSGS